MDHLGGPHAYYDLSPEEQTDAMAFWLTRHNRAKTTAARDRPTGDPAIDAFLARLAKE
jgi:hypothetical protein